MFSYQDIFQDKKRVLFVPAHPDDADIAFGGTTASLIKDKKEVFVLVVTNGGRGSKDNKISEKELSKQRLGEETMALGYLGVPKENLATLNYLDGEVENNMKLIGQIAQVIRRFKPDIVCTHEPHEMYLQRNDRFYVNHRDHRNTGLSVLDAVYPFSRDRSFFPEHSQKGLEPHHVLEILFTRSATHNTKIDITKVIGQKKKALLSHKSQLSKDSVDRILENSKEGSKYFEFGNYLKLF